ncbi:MAG: endo alpha-1,4 polygalactosaminidase [Nitrososphaerota archaeon]
MFTIKNIESIFFDSYKINVELNPGERNAIINYTDNICMTSDNNLNKSCIKDEVNISQTNHNILVEQNYINSDSNYSLNNINYSSDLINISNDGSAKSDDLEILERVNQNNNIDNVLTNDDSFFLKVSSFAYQLQNIDLEKIKNSSYDLIVIDYAPEDKNVGFSKDQISYAKNGKKLIFSYLSIGEAENYRWYWKEEWDADNDGFPDKNAPEWLLESNPNWTGNYFIKFWSPEWQTILFEYINKIIDSGFDGVVLDTVDSYMYFRKERSKDEMKYLVKKISEYSKNKREDFKIVVNGGIELTDDENYINSIDGILKESVFYQNDEANPKEEIEYVVSTLERLRNEGKMVFIIEYVKSKEKIEQAYNESKKHNFLIFFSNPQLDILPKPVK